MNRQVKEHKTLLSKITIPQKAEFHKAVSSQVEPLAPQVNGIAPPFNAYKNAAQALITEYNQRTKSIMTEELVLIDYTRDGITEELIRRINFYLKFPQNEAEAEAARLLKFEADAYKKISSKNYPAETANICGLTTDLRKHSAAIALFDLNPLIVRVETENTSFENGYITRANEIEAKSKHGTLTHFAKQANDAFDVFCRVIDGISLMQLDAATRSAVDQIIDIINAQIHQYTTVYNRHIGKNASHNHNDGGGDDNGDGGDEGDGGDGGDFQEPDIENPPPFGE